jgi:hypothetical protein
LIPIIFSGVFTPLIIVGFFKGYFHPVIALVFIVTGIFTFYLGWIGQKVLTVRKNSDYYDFPVDDPTPHLLAFLEFTNQYIQKAPVEWRLIYKLHDTEGRSGRTGMLDPPHDLYSFRDLRTLLLTYSDKSKFLISGIDPLKMDSVINYVRDMENGRLKPTLPGRINPDAIVREYTMDEFISLPVPK